MIASFLIGVAVWCAAGVVATATTDSATARVVVAAPWWWFFVGVAVAAAVKPLRTQPQHVWPVCFTILPWLPVPMPAVGLLFTGPLAWLPIAAAFGLAIGLHPLRWLARRVNLHEPNDATVAAFVLAALIGGLSAWSAAPRTPAGDEPHYLIISQSVITDGDIDIQNNHDRKDYAAYFSGDLRPDLRVRGRHGEAYSIHAPGVSVLVAPVFQFFGYNGAKFLLVLLVSIGAMLTWRACWRLTDSAAAAWFGWCAVAFTPTFALQSFMVFPDAPGFLITALALLLLVQFHRGDLPRTLPVFCTGVALAALPWLHTRFAVLAAGFGAVIALRLLWPSTAPPRPRSELAEALDPAPVITIEDRVIRLIALLITPVLSAALWFWFFKAHYGTFDPRAPYGPDDPQSLAWIIPAILALFFDGEYGIAAYAPAVALVFAGWWRTTETFTRRLGVELLVIAFGYLAVVSTVRMWWAGNPATPARFLMSVLPILAAPVAVAWVRFSVTARAMATTLIAVGAAVTFIVVGVDHAGLAWNYRCDNAAWLGWLNPVLNLARAWPAFFWNEPHFPWHVLLVAVLAAAWWWVLARQPGPPRVKTAVWGCAGLMLIVSAGWWLPGATRLNAAPAQLSVVRVEGAGARVFAIGAGRVSRLRTLKGALTLAPLAPGSADECPVPPLVSFPNAPAARYTLHVRSSSSAPLPVRVFAGHRDAPWREFVVTGAGLFQFPFILPASVTQLTIDTDPPSRAALAVTLGVDDAMPAGALPPMRSAEHFANTDTLFFDDQVYVEKDGFWVKGQQATRFMLVSATGPVSPLTTKVLVRNGGTNNQVTVESGAYQKLLMMQPFEEVELDIPLTPTGTANVRVASGDGFVPAERTPGTDDRRRLGVWIQPR